MCLSLRFGFDGTLKEEKCTSMGVEDGMGRYISKGIGTEVEGRMMAQRHPCKMMVLGNEMIFFVFYILLAFSSRGEFPFFSSSPRTTCSSFHCRRCCP